MKDTKVLFVCWQHPQDRGIYPVGRLVAREASPRFEFAYIRGATEAHDKHGFQPFLAFPELDRLYLSDDLFPFFANRRMSESREDYEDHVRRLGLDAHSAEPLALLARSGGESATDKVELFAPPEHEPASGAYTYHFFARGVRHVYGAEDRIATLRPGDRLGLLTEPDNQFDPMAVLLLDGAGGKVGYVPHYLVEDLGTFLESDRHVSITVERVNLPPAPVHQRLLCRLRVKPREGFVPFSTARYKLLVEGAAEPARA